MAEDVHAHIEELVAEEHRLWELESNGAAGEEGQRRLAQIKVELDRYWDLLRRRRAAAAAGASADGVPLRSEETVENYLQ
jgi:predicted nuclease with TOPRIM domain